MKIYMIAISMVLIFTFISPTIGDTVSENIDGNKSVGKSTIYRAAIDQYHGFYRVYNATSGKVVAYQGEDLNIYNGDTVLWMNDAVPDTRFTIISEQQLWDDNSADLKWAYKQFIYTFNESGIYSVYIRQYPHFKQKIIVNPTETTSSSNLTIQISELPELSDAKDGTADIIDRTNTVNTKEIDNSIDTSLVPGIESSSPINNNSTGTSKSEENNGDIGPIKYLILSVMITISSVIYVLRKHKYKNILGLILISGVFLSIISGLGPGHIASASTDFYHPNMYLNDNEISIINEKVKANQEPWKTAYGNMISDANSALNLPVQSVTHQGNTGHDYYTESPYCGWKKVDGKDPDCRDGQINPNADRGDYNAAIALGKAVRDLGLAYSFTKDSKYADKAIQLINAWSINSATKMNPHFPTGQSQIELAPTMSSMFYGADLIWNYQGWNSANKEAFKTWTRDFITSAKSHTWCAEFCQNFENWRLVFISSASVIAEDSDNMNYAFNRWKEVIDLEMDTDGSFKHDRDRAAGGLFYSMFVLLPATIVAEVARHQGVDLYNYKLSDGRGLELALDFHAPYTISPGSWPYTKGGFDTDLGRTKSNSAIYEIAYSFKKKSSYEKVISGLGRPMYDMRVLGPTTLTHADSYISIIPGPTYVPTPGPTPAPGTVTGSTGHPTISISFRRTIKMKNYRIPIPVPGPPRIPGSTPSPTHTPTPGSTHIPIPRPTEGEEIGTWKYNDVIIIPTGYGRLHNNIWGASQVERSSNAVKTYIYYKANGNFGWEWNRPDPTPNDPNDYAAPIYPEIIVGTSGPFSSTLPDFPKTLKDVNSLTVEVSYNYVKPTTGKYNLAYDIWFVDSAGNKKAEFMVWIYGDLGSADRYISDGINEYGYFYKPPSSEFNWDYHAFVLRNQNLAPSDHKVNMKSLFDTLINSGKLNPDWKLSGIEFGNEVGRGSGRIEINRFLININGNEIGKR